MKDISESYVGREFEKNFIRSILSEVRDGKKARHFSVIGERGLGKSTLLRYARKLARGETGHVSGHPEKKFNFLVVMAALQPDITLDHLLAQLNLSLRHEKARCNLLGEATKKVGEATERFGGASAFGFGLQVLASVQSEIALEEFAYDLAKLARSRVGTRKKQERSVFRKSKRNFDGILLMFDEVDTAPEELRFGTQLKLLVERLEYFDCTSVVIGVAGLPRLHRILTESHGSSWRLFEHLSLRRLTDPECTELLDSYCEGGVSFSSECREMLVHRARGFPHFVKLLARTAIACARESGAALVPSGVVKAGVDIQTEATEAEKDEPAFVGADPPEPGGPQACTDPVEVSGHHFFMARSEALQEIGDIYYRHEYNALPVFARFAAYEATKRGGEHTVEDLLGQLEGSEASETLAALRECPFAGVRRIGRGPEKVSIDSEGFAEWLQYEMDDIWERTEFPDPRTALHSLGRSLRIHGENVPSFDVAFRKGVNALQEPEDEVLISTYDHEDLFESLEVHDCVRTFQSELGLQPHEGEREAIAKLFRDHDVVAIPHYLLGAIAPLVVRFRDYLDLVGDDWKWFLQETVLGYEELCVFRGQGIAMPFSVVSKVLFSKQSMGSVPLDFSTLIEGGGPRVLTEGKAGSLSLWYEWQQLMAGGTARFLHRQRGEHIPDVSDAVRLQAPATEAQKLQRCLVAYWKLLRQQHEEDIGRRSWIDAWERFDDYDAYLGWTDFSAQLRESHPDAQMTLVKHPVENIVTQALEGWGFVIPSETASREEIGHIVSFLGGLMTRDRVDDFQEVARCSPFREAVRTPASETAGWNPVLLEAIEEGWPKGKTSLEPSYIAVELSLLSYVFFGTSTEEPVLAESPDEVLSRFEGARQSFVATIDALKQADLES